MGVRIKIFADKNNKLPNKISEPTPASVTPAPAQSPRRP
jgi:hypothetical protein